MTNLGLKPPPITITADDLRHLSTLGLTSTEAAEFLAREIDRARIVPVHQVSADLVRMGTVVKYRDNTTRQVSEVTLVYPREVDGEPGYVFGANASWCSTDWVVGGQTIQLVTRSGEVCSLSVIEVSETKG